MRAVACLRAARPLAPNRDHDDVRIHGRQVAVADAQSIRHAVSIVFDHSVTDPDELQQHLPSTRLLEIQTDAQSSVLIGVTVVAIATTLAVSVGSISGYASGWI